MVNEYSVVKSSGWCVIIAPTAGVFVPINDKINLTANIKFQLAGEEFNTGINLGLAYLIP